MADTAPPQPHRVFISYSSSDKRVGDAVCATLEARGHRCWIAPRDIVPGAEWGEAIIDGIRQCNAFVIIFSAHANQSAQVRREIERAVHHGLVVIPFRIEDVPPERALEYFMSTPHWLDALTPPLQQHLDALADVLDRIGDPAPAPFPRGAPQGVSPLRRLAPMLAVGAAFALVPVAAWLGGFDPPWPGGIALLSALGLIAAPFAALSQGRFGPRVVPGRWALGGFVLALSGLLLFFSAYSQFVETIPGKSVRVVRGTVCTADAQLVYGESCPNLPRDALQDAEWEAATLWTRESVTAARMRIAGGWLLFIAGLGLMAPALAVAASRPLRQPQA